MANLKRDTMISPLYDCKGGEKFRITFEISSSVMGYSSSSATSSTYLNTTVGLACSKDSGGNFG